MPFDAGHPRCTYQDRSFSFYKTNDVLIFIDLTDNYINHWTVLKSTPLEPEKLIRFRKYNSPVSLEDTFLVFYKTINCTQVKVVIVDL